MLIHPQRRLNDNKGNNCCVAGATFSYPCSLVDSAGLGLVACPMLKCPFTRH